MRVLETVADRPTQAALLIDADNFSDSAAIEAAWMQLKARANRVSVCRAYGNAGRLQTLAPLWRTLGARTFANLSLEKNTTDAALIADAVALYFQQGVRFFAVASGDADFAPLAVRLREWGCEVWCFSMEGVLFAGAENYYDRVVRFRPSECVTVTAVPESVKPVSALPVKPVAVAPQPLLSPTPVRSRASTANSLTTPEAVAVTAVKSFPIMPRLVPAPSLCPPLPDEVQRILKAIPALREGPQHLSQVVCVLRQQGILGKSVKSTTFLAKHATYFELIPAHQPIRILLRTSLVLPFPSAVVLPSGTTQTPRASEAVVPIVKPTAVGITRTNVANAAAAIRSWPTGMGRQPAPALLTELHGLRSVLLQLAIRRVSVADVLLAVPEMLGGERCALSAVAGRLRQKGLLRSYQSALRVLERHPESFVTAMDRTPQSVTYLR